MTGKKRWTTLLGAVIIVVAVGAYLIRSLQPVLNGHLMMQGGRGKAITVVELLVTLIFLGCIPVVFYLFALGRRSMNSEGLSQSGTNVIRDPQPLKGQREAIRGQMMVFIAILLILFAFLGWMFVRSFIQPLTGK